MKDNLTTALLLIGVLGLFGFVGPTLDDNGPEHEVAREELAKHSQQDRFERAATAVCGPKTSYSLTSTPGEIVCLNKHGRKTKVASL